MRKIIGLLLVCIIIGNIGIVSAVDYVKEVTQEGNSVHVVLNNPEDVAYFDVIDENGEVWGTSDVVPDVNIYDFENIEPNHIYNVKVYPLSDYGYNYGESVDLIEEEYDNSNDEPIVSLGIELEI